MGYRSEVGLAITQKGLSEVLEGDITLTEKVKECLDSADFHEKENDHLFIWEYIKWYDSTFEDISALMKRLNELDPKEYLFIRIGEDPEDLEQKGGYYFNDFDFGYERRLTYSHPSKVV